MGILALRETRNAYYYTQAVNQIYGMSERLHALNIYKGLEDQIAIWNKENQVVLPQGVGRVEGIYPNFTITIFWGEQQRECPQIRIGQNGCISEKITL